MNARGLVTVLPELGVFGLAQALNLGHEVICELLDLQWSPQHEKIF